jgi:hypothetical protein
VININICILTIIIIIILIKFINIKNRQKLEKTNIITIIIIIILLKTFFEKNLIARPKRLGGRTPPRAANTERLG